MKLEEMAELAYDTPIKVNVPTFDKMLSDSIKESILGVTYKFGIDIDEEKLIRILEEDRTRYKEAWIEGYFAGCRDYKEKLDKIQNILDGKEETPDADRS